LEKDKIKVGQEYIHTIVLLNDNKQGRHPHRERKVVRCVGVYRYHVRFDFGHYKQSLTWFDVEKSISSRKGKVAGD